MKAISIEIYTTPNDNGSVTIHCPVMRCEYTIKPEDVRKHAVAILNEYIDLIEADIL